MPCRCISVLATQGCHACFADACLLGAALLCTLDRLEFSPCFGLLGTRAGRHGTALCNNEAKYGQAHKDNFQMHVFFFLLPKSRRLSCLQRLL
uniref:Secreted protein n=1 Tax=Rhipicephalus appendiculatus TaxID=34631 RepID=A0A131YGC6_RHIAP